MITVPGTESLGEMVTVVGEEPVYVYCVLVT